MTEQTTTMYSDLSISLTNTLDKSVKKNEGIFFTPPSTIMKALKFLTPYLDDINEILEPSCGSCEFIHLLKTTFAGKNITGIEYNKTIFDSIAHFSKENINIINHDFLTFTNPKTYNLIIGNPPYFVLKKNEVDSDYYDYFEGRPNIFILFIIKSLQMLSENGILCFILPTSFLNSSYYNKARKFIVENFKILDILPCNDHDYIETKQETIAFIVQKNKDTAANNLFSINKNSYIIFGTQNNIQVLNSLFENSVSLNDIDVKVSVGKVVWNQCKDILTHDDSQTLLVYSSDIKNNKLEVQSYRNPQKKNYIMKSGLNKPLLVVNRGYGNAKYCFSYCLIDGTKEYLIENHLICINYTKEVSNEILTKFYEKIITSLQNEKTKQFVDLYFGNNAINTTELNFILPIYL